MTDDIEERIDEMFGDAPGEENTFYRDSYKSFMYATDIDSVLEGLGGKKKYNLNNTRVELVEDSYFSASKLRDLLELIPDDSGIRVGLGTTEYAEDRDTPGLLLILQGVDEDGNHGTAVLAPVKTAEEKFEDIWCGFFGQVSICEVCGKKFEGDNAAQQKGGHVSSGCPEEEGEDG